jgi:FMN-dependent NADH-azoreductase
MRLLHIDHSIKQNESIVSVLAKKYIAGIKSHYDDIKVEYLDLIKDSFPNLDRSTALLPFFESDKLTDIQLGVLESRKIFSNNLREVDYVVVSAPIWNWNVPASLKAYLDYVIIPNVLDGKSKSSSIKAKSVVLILSQGGGEVDENDNWETQYLERCFKKLGAQNVNVVICNYRNITPGGSKNDFALKANSYEYAIESLEIILQKDTNYVV